MVLRTSILLMFIGTIALPAPKRRDWHTGQLDPVTSVLMDRNGGRAPAGAGETHSFDTATIPLLIRADGRIYKAEETAATMTRAVADDELGRVTLTKSVDAVSAVPWVRELPYTLRFAVEGKTLYYLDAKNKEHRKRPVMAVLLERQQISIKPV